MLMYVELKVLYCGSRDRRMSFAGMRELLGEEVGGGDDDVVAPLNILVKGYVKGYA